MKMSALEDLFVQELNELYAAERRILKALPELQHAAATPALRDALASHRKETKGHVRRLDAIYRSLGTEPEKPKTLPVDSALKHGHELASSRDSDASVRDAAIIAAAQKVEHYEIAGYGCVRAHASLLGYQEAAEMLAATLNEEEAMDARLTEIGTNIVNVEAAKAPFAHARTAPRAAAADARHEAGAGKLLIGMSIGAAALALLWNGGKGLGSCRRTGRELLQY
jgi:ferritin-like metal-binding protein YciE